MKKYEKPTAEKVEFNYSEQVAAASGCWISTQYADTQTGPCTHYIDGAAKV